MGIQEGAISVGVLEVKEPKFLKPESGDEHTPLIQMRSAALCEFFLSSQRAGWYLMIFWEVFRTSITAR